MGILTINYLIKRIPTSCPAFYKIIKLDILKQYLSIDDFIKSIKYARIRNRQIILYS